MEKVTELDESKFGTRYLEDKSEIYMHNAWDNVVWDDEYRCEVMEKIASNSATKVDDDKASELETNADQYWNQFYDKHENKFFKDRHWLFREFPELVPNKNGNEKKTILELGCGAGNTIFPLLELDENETTMIYCCDFSIKAVELVRKNHLYNEKRCYAFQFDLTSSDWANTIPFEPNSLDYVTMIFVLSAIDPKYYQKIIENVRTYLKPTGCILFRDYGHSDLAQTRFKNGRCIKENFYVRGDGTRAYFFTESEIDKLFTDSGLTKLDIHSDRRLLINRANRKKMYRIWIQAKFQNKLLI
ncbi:hypothetical protein RDWZM_000879 [Blomia tropicalis]|uniref:tRNA N(3)-methylcytidine methyltransferase n=1 Tax=Blomia tropicalis TaxID=40697 RepID=A0A9Q0MBE2_BLOTA|nr:hypothetical protein RDWZM_000879 [Blomia tropicalis]